MWPTPKFDADKPAWERANLVWSHANEWLGEPGAAPGRSPWAVPLQEFARRVGAVRDGDAVRFVRDVARALGMKEDVEAHSYTGMSELLVSGGR